MRPSAYCLLIVLTLASPQVLANEDSIEWQLGPQFHQQLQSAVTFSWMDNPLRSGLTNLSRAHRVAIFLDRRIDPGRLIDLDILDRPMEHALHTLARSLDLGIGYLGPVVYVGPPEVTAVLATQAELKRQQVSRLPMKQRSRWQRVEAWQWERLTTPRQLLERLTQQTRCRIENADLVPHDLWPEVELPRMSATDRMSLVLAGFGLTFELTPEGSTVRLLAMPGSVWLERGYAFRSHLAEMLERLTVDTKRVGRRLIVRGTYEDHLAIQRWLRGETGRPSHPAAGVKTHSLTVDRAQAGAIIQTLVRQLGLSVKVAEPVTERLNRTVSFDVKEVPLKELLHQTLDPIGVRFRIVGRTLELEVGDDDHDP